ncbi:cytochrome P450 [Streptomyces sp. LX-29]|uniref:cytochrome P450 n=1 Tax=Streptomyces sp. LX-29 TaxID=2900152 RepID=UPI00240E88BC|nr:cytochrome P450 [Streptomyces sp. LX-29]WFB07806.1 cytochrome P450 [Streptomyces sp. LX-29]
MTGPTGWAGRTRRTGWTGGTGWTRRAEWTGRAERPRAGTAPGALPLLGHAIPLARAPLDFLTSMARHGELVEIRLGARPAHVVCGHGVAHEVFRDARTYDKGGPLFDKVRPIIGNGLASSTWEDHQRQRRLLQQAFQPDRMPGYAAVMGEEIDAVLRHWRPGRILDVGAALYELTTRITVRAMFRGRIEDDAVAELRRCLPVITRGIFTRTILPVDALHRLPTPANRRFDRALARLRQVIDRTIAGYGTTDAGEGNGEDLMSLLIGAEDEETGGRMSRREVHDQVMTLLLGGVETTANLVAWTFHVLGAEPGAEARLHAEVDEVLCGRPPNLADLPELEYARQVLTEVLRQYPPFWLLNRITTREVELAGRRLPAGSTLVISPYALGRDPVAFPDPDRFDPDRWLPARAASLPRGAGFPFGGGARRCIGDRFGMTEALLVLATVAARWRLRPAGGSRVRPTPMITLSLGPLPMVLEERQARTPRA